LAGPFASLQDLLRTPFWEWTAAALGLVVGSFANVCIHRIPLRQSVGSPPSRCPGCGAAIRPWDNVPVVSFLLLRGRCRACGTRISIRYPLVEAANGLAYWAVAVVYGPTLAAAIAMALVTALLVLALIDLDHQILPNVITLPGIVAGLAASTLDPAWPVAGIGRAAFEKLGWPFLAEAPLAAAAGYLAFAAIAAAGHWYWKKEALGQGDWKLAAMLGAFLGVKGLLLTVFIGSLFGAIVGVSLIALGRATMATKIPFGTFLAFAGIAVALAGGRIWHWYASTFGLGGP
jgi:leader peptidase (prepilin peptidase)/N-methyltransferase